MTPDVSVPQSSFAPLPIRRRGTLEVLDTALKLYRRYFWILIGWAALVSVSSLIPFFGFFIFLLFWPFIYTSSACAVAAAVRGQKISFGQVWNFSKPRYGALLGVILVSLILFGIVAVGLIIVGFLSFAAGVYVLDAAPTPIQVVFGIVGFVLVLVLFSLVGLVSFGWLNMVPLIACLEDDKRGMQAMGRATDLMKGNWMRLFRLALLLGLAIMAIFAFVGGFLALMFGGLSAFDPNSNGSSELAFIASAGAISAVFSTLWYPAQSLILAVFYLDLRTRKEALDIEWTNYATTPDAVASEQPTTPAASVPPPNVPVEPMTAASRVAPSSFGVTATTPAPVEAFAPQNDTSLAPPAEATIVPEPFVAPEPTTPIIEPTVAPTTSFGASETTINAVSEEQPTPPPPAPTPEPTSSFSSSFAPSSFAPPAFELDPKEDTVQQPVQHDEADKGDNRV